MTVCAGAATPESESVGMDASAPVNCELWAELWVSLVSLLRGYSAAHGLHRGREADVAWDEARIEARHGEKWLNLHREGRRVAWVRENGNSGTFELTEDGRLRDEAGEEEMDMAAERWARELMR